MNIFRLTATTISLTILVACGGGGGGGAATATSHPLPDALIANTQETRALVGGTAPPNMTSAQMRQTLNSIASNADALLLDLVDLSSGTPIDISVTCTGASCSYTSPDNVFNDPSTDSFVLTGEGFTEYNEQNTVVMTHNGVTIGQRLVAVQDEGVSLEFQTYEGWLANNSFGVALSEVIQPGMMEGTDTRIETQAHSLGDASGTNPSGTGRIVWNGAVVGADKSTSHIVHGTVLIDIDDPASPEVDVFFTDIKNLNTEADVDDMGWGRLTVIDGAFDAGDQIKGVFYGTDHAEVGGVFDRDNILGAFGAVRE